MLKGEQTVGETPALADDLSELSTAETGRQVHVAYVTVLAEV